MTTLLLTIGGVAIAMLMMSVGVMMTGRQLRRSCQVGGEVCTCEASRGDCAKPSRPVLVGIDERSRDRPAP